MGRKITTPKFRVSFPAVFKKHCFQGEDESKAKYSITMLFPKKTNLKEMKKLAKEAIVDKWGDKVPKDLYLPFLDGDEKEYEGYEGHISVKATSKQKPGVVSGFKNDDDVFDPIESEAEFYPGCYARASVTAYAYDTMGNRGVAFGLVNVQKLNDGEPLGNRSRPEDDFEPIDDDDAGDSNADILGDL